MKKVISGGQTGVDTAALRAAKAMGIETGGWCAAGWRTEEGAFPQLAEEYGMQEHGGGYAARNRQNVEDADGTVILYVVEMTGGTLLTANLCREKGGSRWLAVDLDKTKEDEALFVAKAIRKYSVVNFAGPRESKVPGIGHRAEQFLKEVFRLHKQFGPLE